MGRNAKMKSEGARSAVVPVELKGNKLSISDIRKRSFEHEETRAPLSALNGSTPNQLERDFTLALGTQSPVKSTLPIVYRKRPRTGDTPKTGETPPTPPLRSLGRRQELIAASPSPPPVFQSNSPYVRSRRQEFKAASSPPPPVFESGSPLVRNENLGLSKASEPIIAEKESLQPVRRQLMSPTKGQR